MPHADGPIRLTPASEVVLRPADTARITSGLWHQRRAVNAESSVPDGFERLREAGNFHNLRLAAGTADGDYVNDLPFLDSDVYKWLEAIGWVQAEGGAELSEKVDFAVDLLTAAQEPSGYLQSFFQVHDDGKHFTELAWGHEMYCAGHLIQAAVAHARTTGRTDLMDIARRLADHLDDEFGPGRTEGICGHPEIETALVELYRSTNEKRYLLLAGEFVDRRGREQLGGGRHGSRYWQDDVPVRDAQEVVGHAVRQLYLLAGVVDVAVETGDQELLTAAERLWTDMVATKTYLTGGVGAHHSDEAFGDAYELPNERAYCETCAAIASIQFSWRLLLATGQARYADLIERTLHNGFLSGVSLEGDRYLYINPLQVRDDHRLADGDHEANRAAWRRCACCPPNVMRLLASLQHYVAASDESGLLLHQYIPGDYSADELAVHVDTAYPWDGEVTVRITESPGEARTVTLRVPEWADHARVWVSGEEVAATPEDGWLRVARNWRPGDVLRMELPMSPRLVTADPRVDAARGCVAIERGPLVYCVERGMDSTQPRLDDVVLDPDAPMTTEQRDELGGIVAVTATGRVRPRPADSWWPYRRARASSALPEETTPIVAIPYYAWGNRPHTAMRVWLPVS